MVLDSGASAIATVHEYGHLVGLNHRGALSGNNTAGYDPSSAIMDADGGVDIDEVNSNEVGFFENLSTGVTPVGL